VAGVSEVAGERVSGAAGAAGTNNGLAEVVVPGWLAAGRAGAGPGAGLPGRQGVRPGGGQLIRPGREAGDVGPGGRRQAGQRVLARIADDGHGLWGESGPAGPQEQRGLEWPLITRHVRYGPVT
jgi:hypothetical protein